MFNNKLFERLDNIESYFNDDTKKIKSLVFFGEDEKIQTIEWTDLSSKYFKTTVVDAYVLGYLIVPCKPGNHVFSLTSSDTVKTIIVSYEDGSGNVYMVYNNTGYIQLDKLTGVLFFVGTQLLKD